MSKGRANSFKQKQPKNAWGMFDKVISMSSRDIAGKRFDAQEPSAIHQEPVCRGNNNCKYGGLHKHGFSCDNTCNECGGLCHPHCPANETIKKIDERKIQHQI